MRSEFQSQPFMLLSILGALKGYPEAKRQPASVKRQREHTTREELTALFAEDLYAERSA